MQTEEWVQIYSDSQSYKTALVEGILENAGIPCRVISKKDSLYHIGSLRVEVPIEYIGRAKEIVEESIL